MKITNNKNVKHLRLIALTLCLLLMTAACLTSILYLKALFLSIIIIISIYAFTVNSQIYESAAMCISFSKYSFFRKSYVRPYVEIPASFIIDYNIDGFLQAYCLVIIVDNGISKPKNINISLHWFKEAQIIGIVKSLDHIKRRNISESKKEVEQLLMAVSQLHN